MVQSPPSAVNSYSDGQEIQLQNPEVYHYYHKIPPMVSLLYKLNPWWRFSINKTQTTMFKLWYSGLWCYVVMW